MQRYVNFFTDFGFKRLFGSEPAKECLIDFLNELLKDEEEPIKELTYMRTEHLGASELDRHAVFDIYCENEKGEKFIVELQKAKQKFFKDRSVFYATFPIQEQAQKGDWDFRLKAVYTIGILDFVFDEDAEETEKFMYTVKLTDQETHRVFYDKLTFIYLEMPKFNKTEDELETHFDKWLFAIRNLARLDDVPAALREAVFNRFFEMAEIAQFDPEERDAYEQSLKYYRDINNVIANAHEEGYEKAMGEATQKLQMAAAKMEKMIEMLKQAGFSDEEIRRHLEE